MVFGRTGTFGTSGFALNLEQKGANVGNKHLFKTENALLFFPVFVPQTETFQDPCYPSVFLVYMCNYKITE